MPKNGQETKMKCKTIQINANIGNIITVNVVYIDPKNGKVTVSVIGNCKKI